ncbi:hypothetical protein CVT25_001168, partial [Psilocybe cyanescens]
MYVDIPTLPGSKSEYRWMLPPLRRPKKPRPPIPAVIVYQSLQDALQASIDNNARRVQTTTATTKKKKKEGREKPQNAVASSSKHPIILDSVSSSGSIYVPMTKKRMQRDDEVLQVSKKKQKRTRVDVNLTLSDGENPVAVLKPKAKLLRHLGRPPASVSSSSNISRCNKSPLPRKIDLAAHYRKKEKTQGRPNPFVFKHSSQPRTLGLKFISSSSSFGTQAQSHFDLGPSLSKFVPTFANVGEEGLADLWDMGVSRDGQEYQCTTVDPTILAGSAMAEAERKPSESFPDYAADFAPTDAESNADRDEMFEQSQSGAVQPRSGPAAGPWGVQNLSHSVSSPSSVTSPSILEF